jgi:hypothetical protein
MDLYQKLRNQARLKRDSAVQAAHDQYAATVCTIAGLPMRGFRVSTVMSWQWRKATNYRELTVDQAGRLFSTDTRAHASL